MVMAGDLLPFFVLQWSYVPRVGDRIRRAHTSREPEKVRRFALKMPIAVEADRAILI